MERGSIPLVCTKYAPMVELVDTVVLEATASASEFESRLGHQLILHLIYCEYGEIGRHKRLKISRFNRRASSILATRTKVIKLK